MYDQLKRDAKRGLLEHNILCAILEESEKTNELLENVVALLEVKEVIQKQPDYETMELEEIRELIKIKIPAKERPQGWSIKPKDKLIKMLEG